MEKKHVLIVGGTSGMGADLARDFSARRYAVSVIGRSLPGAGRRAVGADYWRADVNDKTRLTAALQAIVKKNGKLDSLLFFQRYRDKGDSWQGELGTSLTATKNIIEHLAGSFKKTSRNSIVVAGSVAGELIADEQSVGYHVAKAGLDQLVRYYAVKLGPGGIRVNSVCPAIVIKEESREFYRQNRALHDLYCSITPLGRMCVSKEILNVVEYLCGPKASFITGQNLVVDGGISLQWQGSLARRIANPRIVKDR